MTRIAAILTAAAALLGMTAPANADHAPTIEGTTRVSWAGPPAVSDISVVSGRNRVGFAVRMKAGNLVYINRPRDQYRLCMAADSQECINTWATFYPVLRSLR